jgi:triacylglycerol lipase
MLFSLLTAALTVTVSAISPLSPAYAATRNPVIFVHGLSGSASNFGPMINGFKKDGYGSGELFAWSYNWTQSNKTSAAGLRDKVDAVLRQTGASKVDIVSHSMGALPTRWYLKFLGGTAKVDDYVSIGAPHHGTNLSPLCSWLLTSCKEMVYGSDMLTALNSGDETPGSVDYTALWSVCDELINPDTSAKLSGARNVNIGCVEHAWQLIDGNTARLTREAVR